MRITHTALAYTLATLALSCTPQDDTPTESSSRVSARYSSDRVAHLVSAPQLAHAALSRDAANLQRVDRPDGTRFIRVTAGFRHATLAVRAADGTLHTSCLNDADEAARLLHGQLP
jgi:hypothetical protein